MGTMLAKRAAVLVIAVGMGLFVATQTFAWQYQDYFQGYHFFPPTQWLKWLTWWGWGELFFVSAAAGSGVCLAMALAVLRIKTAEPEPVSAHWATRADLKRLGLFARDGIVFGAMDGRVVRHNGEGHVLVVGPTGSGKTTSVVIPTILDWPASLIIHDAKHELYNLTAAARSQRGRVVQYDPTSSASHCHNPLACIRLRTDQAIRDTDLIADMLTNPDGEPPRHDAARHFGQLATTLLRGLLLHGLTHPVSPKHSLPAIADWVNRTPLPDIVQEMLGHANPAIAQAAQQTHEIIDRELSGVLSTTRRGLQLFADPLIARMTSQSDLSPKALRGQLQPLTVYVCIPPRDQERLRLLSRLFLRQFLDLATLETQPRHRVLGIMDEFPILRYFPAVAEGPNYLRSYGISLMLVTQGLSQIDALYGSYRRFVESCRYTVIFTQYDRAGAEIFSGMTGDTMREQHRQLVARKPFAVVHQQTTTSTELRPEPLLTATALLGLPEDAVVVKIGGQSAVMLQQTRYWQRPQWVKQVSA